MEYRAVLEVGKWSTPKDLAQWSVSKIWWRVLDSEELWRVIVEETVGEAAPLPNEAFKRLFQRLVCTHFSRPLFSSTAFRIFRSVSRTWSPIVYLSEEIYWDMSSAYVLLEDERALVCGGGAETWATWSTVYLVEKDGRVEKSKEMKEGRAFHGAIQVKECVYAFCGQTSSSARFHIPSLAWSPLPSLSCVLSRVLPCHYLSSIYLPAQLSLFIYSLNQNSWTEVRLAEEGPGLAVAWREELELLTLTSTVRWRDGEFEDTRRHEKWGNLWGNAIPIVCKDVVYLPWGQLLQQIDLISLTSTYIQPISPRRNPYNK